MESKDELNIKTQQLVEPNILSTHFHLPRVFLILVVALLTGAFFATIGYYVGLQNKSSTISTNQQSVASSKSFPQLSLIPTKQAYPTPTINPTDTSTWRIYKNAKYNFMISYPNDIYDQGILEDSYALTEQSNGFLITVKFYDIFNTGRKPNTILFPFTIYDATPADKNDLLMWWKNKISTDIGNHSIPGSYHTQLNFTPFTNCIKAYSPSFTLPPTLYVTAQEFNNPEESFYMYYDFGKPFIMHSVYYSGGACGKVRDYYPYSTITNLK